jgi:hypothetical protein
MSSPIVIHCGERDETQKYWTKGQGALKIMNSGFPQNFSTQLFCVLSSQDNCIFALSRDQQIKLASKVCAVMPLAYVINGG